MILLLLAAQAATPATSSAPATSSWSLLQPVKNEPCVQRPKGAASGRPGGRIDDSGSEKTTGGVADAGKADDIVVCGQPVASQKLPYPDEVTPNGPTPVNRELTGTGALAAEGTPCAARAGGCQVGVDVFGGATQIIRTLQRVVAPGSCCEDPGEGRDFLRLGKDVVHGIGRIGAKKPDKSNRVAIAMEDAPVSTEGKILP